MSKDNKFLNHKFKLRTVLFGAELYRCEECHKEISTEDYKKLNWGESVFGLLKCRGKGYHVYTGKVRIIQHPNGYMFSVSADMTEEDIKNYIEATKGQGKVR